LLSGPNKCAWESIASAGIAKPGARGEKCVANEPIAGPVIVFHVDTTTVVPPGLVSGLIFGGFALFRLLRQFKIGF
jgi:hypothetical protein